MGGVMIYYAHLCCKVSRAFLNLFALRCNARASRTKLEGRLTPSLFSLRKQHMAKKLYVGGLSYSTTDSELADAFAQAGAVESATVITDRMTGRSKGFGFVEMASDAEADAAITLWNGKELGGRTLTVDAARPMAERPPRRFGGGDDRRGPARY